MKSSNLYRIHPDDKLLQAVQEIDFADFSVKERYDIQEWVESMPDVLGEELLIIGKESSYFDGTRERPDLIALDKKGNLVIIELKRDDSGVSIEWQAIKYASYLSKFKVPDLVDLYLRYIVKTEGDEDIDEESVLQRILEFIDEDDLSNVNKDQRLILVSHRFAKEVTSAVSWLIDKYEMDIKVVQLIPYFDIDRQTYYLQSNMILPLPGEEDIIIKASGRLTKKKTFGSGPVKKSDEITVFFEDLAFKLNKKLDDDSRPTKTSRWAGVGDNFRYYHFWYNESLWENWNLSYKLWLFNESATKIERRNKFGIYFEFVKKYLLGKGLTEERLSKLIEFTKSVNIEGFKFYEHSGGYYLEKLFQNENLSDQNKDNLVNSLYALIVATKQKVTEIIEES